METNKRNARSPRQAANCIENSGKSKSSKRREKSADMSPAAARSHVLTAKLIKMPSPFERRAVRRFEPRARQEAASPACVMRFSES